MMSHRKQGPFHPGSLWRCSQSQRDFLVLRDPTGVACLLVDLTVGLCLQLT